MTVPSLRRLRQTLPIFGLWLCWSWFTGCASPTKGPIVRVVPSDPPTVASARPLPTLPDTHPELPFVLSESGRFTDPGILKLCAAREAYWNRDTDTAVKLLRELRQDDVIWPEHFHWLVLQCYEESGRWAETLPLYAEFGIEQSHREWLEVARLMADLPSRELEFATETAPMPITQDNYDWVVVEGSINGIKARLLVDTGASLSAFSDEFAQRAGVRSLGRTMSVDDTYGREREIPLAFVRELRLGGLTVRNMPALVGFSRELKNTIQADGIVGWDILRHADITLDFPGRLMTVAAPSGPVSAQPNLSGCRQPILTALSTEGRPLHLFLDTGLASATPEMKVFDNDGVLATKVDLSQFHGNWWPTFRRAAHGWSVSWPRTARPFAFWFGGYRFEVPIADCYKGLRQKERLVLLDGVVGNAPFLAGKLRVSGVRREVAFEMPPARPATDTSCRPRG